MLINRMDCIRRSLSIATRGLGLALFLSGLTACSSLRSADIPPQGKVTLKMNANFNRDNYSVVTRAYVYPPLKMDGKGALLEKLSYAEDVDGNLHWHAPSIEAAEIRTVIESQLIKRGLRMVPFQEILDPQNEYSILVFNAYYTPILSKDDTRQVQVLFTRLTGVLLPKELDLGGKQERINQEVFVRFNTSDDVTAAVKTSFQQSVAHIGENDQWIETYPLAK